METHRDDPIGPPPDQDFPDPWDRLAAQFSSLGEKLKEHYESAAGNEGPSEDEVREALRTLGGAWDRVMGVVAAAFKDDDVRSSVKQAARTFTEALGAAFHEISTFTDGTQPDRDQDPGDEGEESE